MKTNNSATILPSLAPSLQFLRLLTVHNDREWFALNKEFYASCRADFEQVSAEYLRRLTEIDDELQGVSVKDCIWRIYRDTRFSADKRPYKDWFGVYVAAPICINGEDKFPGRKSPKAGYYFHLQPGNCLFSAGIWCPEKETLLRLRREIYNNYDELGQLVANSKWQHYFGDFDTDQMLKKAPAGFDSDFPRMDWLRRKAFTVTAHLTDEQVCADSLMDILADMAAAAQPVNRFLNYIFE